MHKLLLTITEDLPCHSPKSDITKYTKKPPLVTICFTFSKHEVYDKMDDIY